MQKKYNKRKKNAKMSSLLEEQCQQASFFMHPSCILQDQAAVASAGGYMLEGRSWGSTSGRSRPRKAN